MFVKGHMTTKMRTLLVGVSSVEGLIDVVYNSKFVPKAA